VRAGQPDYLILGLVAVLLVLGLITVYSASFAVGQLEYNDATYFAARQALWAGVGVLLLYFLSRWAHWSPPITDYQDFFENPWMNLQAMVLPAVAGGLAAGAIIMRFLRSQLLEVLRQDYVRTAWAKGLRERAVVMRHALKNALIPVLTVVGLLLATVASGNVVLETLFNLPGLGLFAVNAIQQGDYPVVQGVVLLVATTLVFVNLLVDAAYAWLDPRIRYG